MRLTHRRLAHRRLAHRRLTRRRFLLAAVATSLVGRVRAEHWEWRGSALGAEARIVLTGPRDQAEAMLAEVAAEIDRFESIFSLHRRTSQLSRLNAAGSLDAPARDLSDALTASARWKRLTGGAFDPAVQPLWQHWAEGAAEPQHRALERVQAAKIDLAAGRITMSPGAALTLNGIAQGIVADRVAALLIRHGFTAPLIDTGEMRLPGPKRRPVDLPDAGLRLLLAEAAVATSAPAALSFEPTGRRHHLFDPSSGDSPGWWRSVTVIAPTAEAADALSTGFAVSTPEMIGDLTASLTDVTVIATSRLGKTRTFGAARMLSESSPT
jgi:thiamine biosynthesis lipoprotein